MATTNYSPTSTLPANIDAERSILGAILLDNFAYNEAAEHLKADDFSLDAQWRTRQFETVDADQLRCQLLGHARRVESLRSNQLRGEKVLGMVSRA